MERHRPTGRILNMAAWQPRSVVNGPGERFVLWCQGCPRYCPGCVNQEMIPLPDKYLVHVRHLVDRILSEEEIEGVSYTGGEPFLQAEPLALLTEDLRKASLTVFCWTGYTLEELRESPNSAIRELLAMIDILVDGPYVREKATNLPWRGSSNQRIHFLTSAYEGLRDKAGRAEKEMEFTLDGAGYTATGIWTEKVMKRLTEILEGKA